MKNISYSCRSDSTDSLNTGLAVYRQPSVLYISRRVLKGILIVYRLEQDNLMAMQCHNSCNFQQINEIRATLIQAPHDLNSSFLTIIFQKNKQLLIHKIHITVLFCRKDTDPQLYFKQSGYGYSNPSISRTARFFFSSTTSA